MEDQEKKSTKYCHTEDNKHLLVSYVDKQKTVKKVLSTVQKNLRVTRDRRKKSNMIV